MARSLIVNMSVITSPVLREERACFAFYSGMMQKILPFGTFPVITVQQSEKDAECPHRSRRHGI
jgi:hypothetical protein